jgi:hypothetical protein
MNVSELFCWKIKNLTSVAMLANSWQQMLHLLHALHLSFSVLLVLLVVQEVIILWMVIISSTKQMHGVNVTAEKCALNQENKIIFPKTVQIRAYIQKQTKGVMEAPIHIDESCRTHWMLPAVCM